MSFENVTNEMGVVVNFAQNCEKHGYRIVSVQSLYPDSVVFSEHLNRELLVEFEYKSSSFFQHGHDIRGCDAIVCWVQDEKVGIPTIVLSENVWEIDNLAPEMLKENIYYKRENEVLRKHMNNMNKLLLETGGDTGKIGVSRVDNLDLRDEHIDCSNPVTRAALKYIMEKSGGYRSFASESGVSHMTVARFVKIIKKHRTKEEIALMYMASLQAMSDEYEEEE